MSVDNSNEYRLYPPEDTLQSNAANNNTKTTLLAGVEPTSDLSIKSALDTCKKSTKRNGSTYPTLEFEHEWDGWNHGMLALARTHDVSEVLDPDYIPQSNLDV